MGKVSEMSMTIEELRNAAAAITEAADWLTQQFSGDTTDKQPINDTAAESKPKPAPKPAITLEQVRAVLAEKSRAGHMAEIRALLAKHGAPKLSQIDPAEYEALLKDAEVIGDA